MRKLSTQILVSQTVILTITVLVGFALFVRAERGYLDREYQQRALDIAQATSQVPQIQRCLVPGVHCGSRVQEIASHVAATTGASYVVVIDMDRVRHSHPFPRLIGQKIEEPIATLDGRPHTTIDSGSTGRSANGKAPLYGPDGAMVGEVSVGLRESSVSAALVAKLPGYALWFAIALAFGAAASWLLARRLKRRTFGLELDEIATLLREREAVLHGIREGMIAVDPDGSITLINDEARRLVGLATTALGGSLEDLLPPGRLRDVLTGAIEGKDQVVLSDDFCLTVNRMPVTLDGREQGAVVTLRDRTEIVGLLRELDSVQGLSEALRAQQHEYSNRMHTLAGLLELGERDEAMSYLTDVSGQQVAFTEEVRAKIASPLVVGVILAKATIAAERGLVLEVCERTRLGQVSALEQALTTILGNLIDNALDALSTPYAAERQGWVRVSIVEERQEVRIRVEDNGPGIPDGAAARIFTDGYSTKPSEGILRRGLGLALVHRIVQRLGGTITASEGPGAVFAINLPKEAA